MSCVRVLVRARKVDHECVFGGLRKGIFAREWSNARKCFKSCFNTPPFVFELKSLSVFFISVSDRSRGSSADRSVRYARFVASV